MASDLSKYIGNKIARWLAGNAMPTAPTSVYVAIFNGDPKSSGVEITTNISAAGRVAISWAALASNDTDNVLTSNADADFGDSDTGSLSASHVAIFDAHTSGNRLASKALPGGPYAIALGQTVKFASGDLSFTIGS